MYIRGWAIRTGRGKYLGFAPTVWGQCSLGHTGIGFYYAEITAKAALEMLKKDYPKYARKKKVVPVIVEMWEASSPRPRRA